MYLTNKNKSRPENTPGSNGLRGAKKAYSCKIAVGPWLEEWGGQSYYHRGFHKPEFETEAISAQLNGLKFKPSTYGAGINDAPDRKTTVKDSFSVNDKEKWATNYQLMGTYAWHGQVEETLFPVKDEVKDILTTYRQQWTTDTHKSRHMRFQTETIVASNFLSDKFKSESIRSLPGTPKALERLHQKIIDKYGILSITITRYYINQITNYNKYIHTKELQNVITNKLDVKIPNVDFLQILAYFTPDDTIIVDQLITVLAGRIEGFDESITSDLFSSLFNIKDIHSRITLDDFKSKINSSTYPEVVEGIIQFISAYSNGSIDITIGIPEFILLHNDMFASNRRDYHEVIDSIWNIK